MSDKLGWLTLAYDNGHLMMGQFCGGLCAGRWLRDAEDRLQQALLGKRAVGES